MGQVLHKRATTTHAIREAIQKSPESAAKLAAKYSLNKKTVLKWKKRAHVEDAKMGRHQSLTVLKPEHEAMIVMMRKTTNLSMDDIFIALQDEIPEMTRSNLHRCLVRNGVNKRREPEADSSGAKKEFKTYEIGFFHIDSAEINLGEGRKYYLFVGIDRTSKFAYARLYHRKTAQSALDFLTRLKQIVPYPLTKILTDNGIEFTDVATHKGVPSGCHMFDQFCKQEAIEHRLTKPYHPWTNGQVERMNRTLKEATVKTYHYDSFEQLQEHLALYLQAYNSAKRLKSLRFKTPLEFLAQKFFNNPIPFEYNPTLYYTGQNN